MSGSATEANVEPPLTHPEEMRADYDLRIGRSFNLKGTARITPAGVVTLGIAVAAILLSSAVLVRASRAAKPDTGRWAKPNGWAKITRSR